MSLSASCVAVWTTLMTQRDLQQLTCQTPADMTTVTDNKPVDTDITEDTRYSDEALLHTKQKPTDKAINWADLIISRVKRGVRSGKNKKKKLRNGKSGKGRYKKFCNKISKCPTTSGSNTKQSLRASHFTIDGHNTADNVLRGMKAAEWVQDNIHQAAQPNDTDVVVTQSGVYLVYSTVLFNDTKYREGLLVMRNEQQLFKCFDGVDYIDRSKTRQQNFKLKTCSMTGVTYLTSGDRLRLVNLYPGTRIETSDGATFFGMIQLLASQEPNTSK